MQSNENKYFNITLKEDEILTFDTNIEQPVTLLKVIATATNGTGYSDSDASEALTVETLAE